MSPAPSAPSILVVDDALESVRLLGGMLLEQGYRVRKVLNGQMALTATEAAPPDLILLDINMPELSGYEVCRQLKSNPNTRDIPVIFISALDEAFDKARAFAVGGIDYIVKPFQFEEVVSRVAAQLTLRSQTLELQQQRDRAQQAELNWFHTFNHAPWGIFHLAPEGFYLRVNPALARLYGYESPEAMLRKLSHYPQPLYAVAEDWEALLEQLETDGHTHRTASEILKADGSSISVQESIYSVQGLQSELLYYEGYVLVCDGRDGA